MRPLTRTRKQATKAGRYASYKQPPILIDYECAFRVSIAQYGSLSAANEHASRALTQRHRAYYQRREAAALGGNKRRLIRRDSISHPNKHDYNPLRSMAIARVPWLNSHTQEADWGLHCRAGVDAHRQPEYLIHPDEARKYSAAALWSM